MINFITGSAKMKRQCSLDLKPSRFPTTSPIQLNLTIELQASHAWQGMYMAERLYTPLRQATPKRMSLGKAEPYMLLSTSPSK